MCSLVDGTFDLEALSGSDLPFPNSPSPVIIAETGNQFNSQFTSSVIVQVEGELLIFIGTESGVLLKVIIE